MDDFGEKLGSVFTAYIGRVVAFVLAPVLLVAVPPVTNAINEVLGTGYSDQQISNVAIAICVGLALVFWQWLRNRGDWENKLAELEALYEAGKQNVAMSEGMVGVEAPPDAPLSEPPSASSSALGTQPRPKE